MVLLVAVWKLLSSRIVDNEQNRSNRFTVAAELNAEISDQPFPFWGCPSNHEQRHLTSKCGGHHSPVGMPEFRFTDRRNRGPQPVWPFETGFKLAPRSDRDWTILHAEIYPSIKIWKQESGECKDKAQVRGLAEYFAKEDEAGTISNLFEAPSGLSAAALDAITAEEGWILGVK